MFINRIFYLILLLLILSGLFVYYTDNYPKHSPYNQFNNSKDIAYEGEVTKIYNDGFVLTNLNAKNNRSINVKSLKKVSLGDTIQVKGHIIDQNTIQSINIIIYSNWELDFVIYFSVIGLLILIIIFFWYWTLDVENFNFIRRR